MTPRNNIRKAGTMGAGALLTLMLVVGGFAAFPSRANAQWAVADFGNLIPNLLSEAWAARQDIKEYVLDPLLYATINTVIDSIKQSTVEWAQNGFDGSPAFVTDLQNNLRNLGDAVTDDFYRQLIAQGSVKSPFLTRIALQVRDGYYRSSGGFGERAVYNLFETCPDHERFLNGDFSACGLSGWISAWRNPWNNPIGAQISAEEELARRLASAVTDRMQEIELGSGFLSKRKCTPAAGGVPQPSMGTSLSTSEAGYRCQIVTPGSLINQQIHTALGADMARLVSADEIDEVLAGLAANLITKGLDDFLGSGNDGGTQNNGAISPTLSTNFLYAIEQQIRSIDTYRSNWQKILTEATRAANRLAQCEDLADEDDIEAVEDIIAEAQAGVAKAAEATAVLSEFRVRAVAARNQTQFQALSTEYQALLGSGKIPSAAEFAYATEQSQNVENDAGETLMAKVVRIMNQPRCGIFNND